MGTGEGWSLGRKDSIHLLQQKITASPERPRKGQRRETPKIDQSTLSPGCGVCQGERWRLSDNEQRAHSLQALPGKRNLRIYQVVQ